MMANKLPKIILTDTFTRHSRKGGWLNVGGFSTPKARVEAVRTDFGYILGLSDCSTGIMVRSVSLVRMSDPERHIKSGYNISDYFFGKSAPFSRKKIMDGLLAVDLSQIGEKIELVTLEDALGYCAAFEAMALETGAKRTRLSKVGRVINRCLGRGLHYSQA